MHLELSSATWQPFCSSLNVNSLRSEWNCLKKFWWPVNSPHKWPVTWKMFSFDGKMVICHLCFVFQPQIPANNILPTLHEVDIYSWVSLYSDLDLLLTVNPLSCIHSAVDWPRCVSYMTTLERLMCLYHLLRVTYFTQEVRPSLAKPPLKFNNSLAKILWNSSEK